MEQTMFAVVDLLGTFAFALSGAEAAKEKRLDLFGVYAVTYLTACGGGIARDLCLGAVPPAAISDWRYLAVTALTATVTLRASPWRGRLRHPVTFFDSLGLGFFAVLGAQKALSYGANVEVAIVLGMLTAVGGGVMRDVLLRRVPIILAKEIYALPALVAAVIQVVGEVNQWPIGGTAWIAAGACFVIRILAVHYRWALPRIGRDERLSI
jgi:uncharacterized membrane protein YeiH